MAGDLEILAVVREHGPLKCAQVARALGISASAAWNALHRLEKENQLARFYVKRANFTTPPYYLRRIKTHETVVT